MKPSISLARILFIVLFLQAIPSLGIDEFSPSLPAMTDYFGVSRGAMQLSITTYVLGMAIGCFFGGALSDRFGRRRSQFICLLLFFLGSIICYFSTDYALLIIGRVLQGIGISIPALNVGAVIADTCEGARLHVAATFQIIVYSTFPIIAPVIGGYIQYYMGWRENFVFLFLFTLVISFILWFLQKETHEGGKDDAFHPVDLVRKYRRVLANPKYFFSVLSLMFAWSIIITFSLIGPFLFEEVLGFSARDYGLIALIVGAGFLLGNVINLILMKVLSVEFWINFGLWGTIATSVVFLLLSIAGVFNLYSVLIPAFVVVFFMGISFSHLYSAALGTLVGTGDAGIGMGLLGTMIPFGAFVFTYGITCFHPHSPIVLAGVYTVFSVLSLGMHYLIYAFRKR